MDILLKKMMETTWGKSLLFVILAAQSSAIVWLAFENKRVNELRIFEGKEHRAEILDTERRCAHEIDALNKQHSEFLTSAIRRMEQIEDRQKKKKR